MKLATYYRMVGDDVRFYKGDMRSLAVELICDDLINHLSIILPEVFWKDYYPTLFEFIKLGKYAILESDSIFEDEMVLDVVKEYRKKYKDKEYFTKPRFDKVGITTLFTFYWDITIDIFILSEGIYFDECADKKKRGKPILLSFPHLLTSQCSCPYQLSLGTRCKSGWFFYFLSCRAALFGKSFRLPVNVLYNSVNKIDNWLSNIANCKPML